MRRHAVAFAVVGSGLVACALTTDLDGLTSATPKGDGGNAQTTMSSDGRVGTDPDGGACGDTASDAHHCGRCDHDCLGGACVAGKCQTFVLASGLDQPLGIGLSQGKLYVGVQGALLEMGLDGKDAKPVISGVRPRYVWGTDTDFFFSREADATIQRWPHSADGQTTFIVGAPTVHGVAASPTHVYYTRYQPAAKGGGIYRVTYPDPGAGPEKLKEWDGAECVALADGKVYFAGDGADMAALLREDGTVEPLLEKGGPTGISVIGNDAFITRQGAGELVRVDLGTKETELLAHDLEAPSGIVATATALYFVELRAGTVRGLAR